MNITYHLDRVRGLRERNSETDLCRHLRRHFEGRLSGKEKEKFASLLDTTVRAVAKKCCRLQSADRDVVCQDVLCRLVAGEWKASSALRAMASAADNATQLLPYLNAYIRRRLKAAESDLRRQRRRDHWVGLEEAPDGALIQNETEAAEPFPCLGDVVEVLETPTKRRWASRDRAIVRTVLENGGSHLAAAKQHGVSPRTVSRAVARTRDFLTSAFEIS